MTHPSAHLYTDSDVTLDAATGKLRCYYQGVPNDYMDHDMQALPISAVVNGVLVVVGSGKMGIVYAMNASTGALLWKTPVGEHNGIDDNGLLLLEHKITLKAPYTILPGSLGGVLSNMAVADGTVYVATIDLAIKATSLSEVVGITAGSAPAGEVEALSLDRLPASAASVDQRADRDRRKLGDHPRGRSADVSDERVRREGPTGGLYRALGP